MLQEIYLVHKIIHHLTIKNEKIILQELELRLWI